MLKRLLSMVLILCLLASCAFAEAVVPADAASADASAQELPAFPQGLAVLNGRLYAATYDRLYQQADEGWQSAASTAELNGDVLGMTADGDTLYLLLRSYAMEETVEEPFALYGFSQQKDGTLAQPQLLYEFDFQLSDDWPQLHGMTVYQNTLYALVYDYSSSDWGRNILFTISLADGAVARLTEDYIQALAVTSSGLIGIYWNQREAYQEDGSVIMPELVSIDPASGKPAVLTTLESADAFGLVHDSATGYTYIAYGNRLMRFDNTLSQGELCGYLPPNSNSGNGMFAVLDGLYYHADWSDDSRYVNAVTVDPALLPSRTLRIQNMFFDDSVIRAFCKEYPDIAVELVNTYDTSAETVTQSMRDANPVDVYVQYLSNGVYMSLRDKGYVADLSASSVLTDAIGAMYPNMTAELYKDGKLMAVPVYVSASAFGYYPAALEKVGLTVDDLPTSLEGLMDFIILWNEEYMDEYPEIKLFGDAYSLYDQLVSLIFSQRLVECAGRGETLSFNTPEIRGLFAKLEQLKPLLEDMSLEPEADGSYMYWGPFGDDGEPTSFFSTYADLLPSRYGNSDWDATPCLLSLTEGTEQYAALAMAVSFINPASPNIDLATLWLEYYVQHMNQADQIALYPTANEPYEYEYYQENLENIQKILAEYEKNLAEAEDAEKSMWEENITWVREELASIKEDRWAISEDDIAAYRELAPKLVVLTGNIFAGGEDNEAYKLVRRFTDGQINVDQFIREFDRIITMMQMESY